MSARNENSLNESLQTRSLPQCCLLAMDIMGALLKSGKRKKSSTSDYLEKKILFERKWSLKPTTNGYGFDNLHVLQRRL